MNNCKKTIQMYNENALNRKEVFNEWKICHSVEESDGT